MKHLRKFNEELDRIVMGSDIKGDGYLPKKINLNINIPPSMVSIAKKFGVTDENMEEVFNNYIQHLLGTIYNTEGDEFILWCEDSDNIADYISEGKIEKAYKSKDSDVKKEMFRDKIKDFLKSKDCKISQVGDDFEIHKDTEDMVQVMFRNDKITVRKEGNKFGKDFDYNQLGDVKKELSKIIG
jgi:hypothetical protein